MAAVGLSSSDTMLRGSAPTTTTTTTEEQILQDNNSKPSTRRRSRILRPRETTLSSGQSSLILGASTNAKNNKENQPFPQTTGTLKTLMIRVIDSKNVQPEQSIEQLENGIYKDDSSFKSQIEACSYKKLEIQPFSGTTLNGQTINDGVTDVEIDYDVSLGTENKVDLKNAAFAAANDQIGGLESDDFDLVMFCLPPQPNNSMIANQFVGTKYTFYDSKWCSSVGVLMHEVGHTLGLANSNTLEANSDIISYGDKTGAMGAFDAKSSARCYNAAKSHQLGWYNDQVKSINPLNHNQSGDSSIPEFIINGVSDYGNNPDALVVLKLQQQKEVGDFFIGYNRADGIHTETSVDKNKITILRTDGENGSYGNSTKVAAIRLGQSHTLLDFNGIIGRDVAIRFVGLFEGNAMIQVMDVKKTDPTPILHTTGRHCSNYTIEVTTDAYPGDIYWTISENEGRGRVVAKSLVYESQDTTTTSTVCLPDRNNDNAQYTFQIFDEYGDGLCCDYGNGSFKVFDPSGSELFQGDQASEDVFDAQKKFGVDHTAETLAQPLRKGPCKDKRRKIEWDPTEKKKRYCSWIAKRNKCNVLLDNGEPLWTLCQESCDKCSA
jgi:hypothetical protein